MGMKTSHVPLGGGGPTIQVCHKVTREVELKKISLVPDLMLKICIIDPHLFGRGGGGQVILFCSA